MKPKLEAELEKARVRNRARLGHNTPAKSNGEFDQLPARSESESVSAAPTVSTAVALTPPPMRQELTLVSRGGLVARYSDFGIATGAALSPDTEMQIAAIFA
jgi:hypothetical protein